MAAISAPYLLPAPGSASGSAPVLKCSIHGSGHVSLSCAPNRCVPLFVRLFVCLLRMWCTEVAFMCSLVAISRLGDWCADEQRCTWNTTLALIVHEPISEPCFRVRQALLLGGHHFVAGPFYSAKVFCLVRCVPVIRHGGLAEQHLTASVVRIPYTASRDQSAQSARTAHSTAVAPVLAQHHSGTPAGLGDATGALGSVCQLVRSAHALNMCRCMRCSA